MMKLIIKVAGEAEKEAILRVLTEAEESGELDFAFNVQVKEEK
jgi:hypothetical protein